MSLYLCVDCGGSKTSAVICDASGAVVGRALSGPSNFAYLGVAAFTREVALAVSNALKTCTTPPSVAPVALPPAATPFAQAWFGISGVDSAGAAASASRALSALLGLPEGPRLLVANDTHLLAAPLRTHAHLKHAVAVIGGTGAVVVSFGHTPGGGGGLEALGRVGGWGWILGDEGGGFHVGREAVRQLLVDADRGTLGGAPPPRSVLKERLLARFGLTEETAMELLTIIHLPDPSPAAVQPPDAPPHLLVAREKRLSQLPPLVFEAAFVDGDAFALRVLHICARTLASQIQVVLRAPNDPDAPPKSVLAAESVLCFGGSLVGQARYRDLVLDMLASEGLGGHVFAYVEFLDDVAKTGAESLALAAQGVEKSNADL
ncbi:hypothetical protein HWV62_29501 [Athelia sp. TMB]|nr:hypothetical protein HWV62_29501 [Athelia sp. TMB]